MVTRYEDAIVRFKALAHPVRMQILDMLRSGEVCVCHMETALGKRQAYISQQLMVLRDAGLVESRKEGLSVFYRVADDVVFDLLEISLGPVDDNAPELFETCPCPQCVEAVSEIVS